MSVEDLWWRTVTDESGRTSKVKTPLYGKGRQWQVRWRSGGKQVKRRFEGKTDAKRFDAKQQADPESRPTKRSWTVSQMCAAWLKTVDVRPSTMTAYRFEVAEINKAFGDRSAASVKPSEVRTWVLRPHPGVSVRRRCLVSLRAAYKLAVLDGSVPRDPTVGAKPPKEVKSDPQFLTWQALEHLAICAGDDAPLIWMLGTGGFRLSEAIGLNQDDVDRERGRVRVRKSKTDAGVREVPMEAGVLDLLSTHDGPLFRGALGGRLNGHNWRERRFREIAEAAGLSPAFTPHKLRHTAASLAIASGADVKTVALMLGHATPAITLKTYSHLFEDRLSEVSEKMGVARRAAGIEHVALRGRTSDAKGTQQAPAGLSQDQPAVAELEAETGSD